MILHPHQAEGIEFLLGRRCAILGHDPGMGKGLTALSAFHEASRAFPGGRSLIIVAPASVITSTWKKEIPKWFPDLPVHTKPFRFPKAGTVLLCNYEALKLEGWPECPTDLVFDEPHDRLKNPNTAAWRRGELLRTACLQSGGYHWLLTATPLDRAPDDFFYLLSFCVGQKPDTRNLAAFMGEWGYSEAVTGGWEKTRPADWSRITKLLSHIVHVRRREDTASGIPVPTWTDVPVTLTPQDLAELNIYSGIPDDVWTPASDLVTGTPIFMVRSMIARLKGPFARAFTGVLRAQGKRVIVASSHQEPIMTFEHHTTGMDSASKRRKIWDLFQSRVIDCVAITSGVGKVGIDLSTATAMVLIDLPWKPGELKQLISRASRPGNTGLDVYNLTIDHHIDARAGELIKEREFDCHHLYGGLKRY